MFAFVRRHRYRYGLFKLYQTSTAAIQLKTSWLITEPFIFAVLMHLGYCLGCESFICYTVGWIIISYYYYKTKPIQQYANKKLLCDSWQQNVIMQNSCSSCSRNNARIQILVMVTDFKIIKYTPNQLICYLIGRNAATKIHNEMAQNTVSVNRFMSQWPGWELWLFRNSFQHNYLKKLQENFTLSNYVHFK